MAPFWHRQIFVFVEHQGCCNLNDAETRFDSLPQCDRNHHFYDQRYAQSPTVEPLSEDMVRLVRSQLATLFYERMANGFLFTLQFRWEWSDDNIQYRIRTFKQVRLRPRMFAPLSPLVREHLLEYADVHVAFYFDWFLHTFVHDNIGFSPRRLGRYIWRKWFHWHGGRPPFLGYQKFAKPINLTGSKPRDMQNLREFHRSLCDAVEIGLSQQELPKATPWTHRSSRTRLQPANPNPSQLTNLRTYQDRGREMAHLFRAIIMVVDGQVMRYKEPEIYRVVSTLPEVDVLAHTERYRDWLAFQHSVLLFRTGDDAHLSSPVSFQSLYDSGKALPVNRPDYDDDGLNVIRVQIDTALEFVFDLIQREREAVPSVGLAAEKENRQHSEVCEKWVDGVMEHAGRVGIDTNGFTWEAVRRAKAALNGEAFDAFQVDPPWNHLGATSLPLGWVDPPNEF
ncbi:uncharacterized protein F4807DRAFT_456326 [Annulohypoxylon truncatum]|uniref:uncharacterized protein n=1 Tax=Annulohypoxylon truncatum TaxID=327061 RepID=UPI00200873EB|nr:uncharacterized protein F4807DRAFT_456326 [Annulohypoxylon truncatum]KAI1213778.1 hypothetical protein F4807DRAFT_456326 [Annulohypoxylon truncatum]